MFLRQKREQTFDKRLAKVLESPIPKHVAIIMDGNGRWAKQRMLPRIAGHKEGMEVVRTVTRFADRLGIHVLTLYAFSTENWKRSKDEVGYLMKLPEEFLTKFLPELMERNVRVTTIGEIEQVPDSTQEAIRHAAEKTANNSGLVLNFAFNYGSRAEMMLALNRIVLDVQNGTINEPVSEELFSQYLMTANLPDPDLLIRTSGELRLSNFLLWQLAYSEFYFSEILWPDFDESEFLTAIAAYQSRERRLGGRIGEGENQK